MTKIPIFNRQDIINFPRSSSTTSIDSNNYSHFYFLRFPITAQNFIKKRTKIPKIEKKAVFIRTCLDFKDIINFHRSSSTTSIDSNNYSDFDFLRFPITAQNFIKKRTKIRNKSRFHPARDSISRILLMFPDRAGRPRSTQTIIPISIFSVFP